MLKSNTLSMEKPRLRAAHGAESEQGFRDCNLFHQDKAYGEVRISISNLLDGPVNIQPLLQAWPNRLSTCTQVSNTNI